MIRKILLALAALVLAAALVVGVEVWLALERDYLPTDPPLALGGTFGDPDAEVLRFVVLGDSTAAGLGAKDASGAYATILAERLARARDVRVELTVLGISGARVSDVLNEQVPQVEDLDPDLIFVGIGANDVTHLTPLGRIEKDMAAIVERLKETGAEVVIAGPPDMRATAWHQPLRWLAGIRGEQVASVIEQVGHSHGVGVVELADETGPFFEAEPGLHFSSDEFHPSALGYKRWADAIYPVLQDALDG